MKKSFVVILPDNLEEGDLEITKPLFSNPIIKTKGKVVDEKSGLYAFEIQDDNEFSEKVNAKLAEIGRTLSYAGRRSLAGYDMLIIIKPCPIR